MVSHYHSQIVEVGCSCQCGTCDILYIVKMALNDDPQTFPPCTKFKHFPLFCKQTEMSNFIAREKQKTENANRAKLRAQEQQTEYVEWHKNRRCKNGEAYTPPHRRVT